MTIRVVVCNKCGAMSGDLNSYPSIDGLLYCPKCYEILKPKNRSTNEQQSNDNPHPGE